MPATGHPNNIRSVAREVFYGEMIVAFLFTLDVEELLYPCFERTDITYPSPVMRFARGVGSLLSNPWGELSLRRRHQSRRPDASSSLTTV